MVSVGTLLSVGLVAAVGIGAYAVYRNADKVGSALSTGFTRSVFDPFGDWLDNLFKNGNGNGNGNGSGTAPPLLEDPNLLPEAAAPGPTTDPPLTVSQAEILTTKYLPGATKSASRALEFVNPGSVMRVRELARQAARNLSAPKLAEQFAIVDIIRESVGGAKPATNKYYDFMDTRKEEAIPLSREAVAYYRDVVGRNVREVYL